MPLSHNPLFVGREEDLKTLARQLKAGETSAVGQVEIAAATGLGGIGKTQLASEFVHRYGRFFVGGVFWMSFADAAAVPIEVASCGRNLGLHASFDTLGLDQQVPLVEEAWRSPLPRLLVFDNCEEEDLLDRWRPPFGGARVLVTSRRPEWNPILDVKAVPLTTLPRSTSIELLRRFRPDVPETESALNAIAADLGDLPLALHLAGSFLSTYRRSPLGVPTAYLNALRQNDLLEHPSLQHGSVRLPTKHESHVGRTFSLSFKRLDPVNPIDALAVALLSRAAWFAPGEPIPRSLLLETTHSDSGDQIGEDALLRLSDLGLLESNEWNALLMHRLVATWAFGLTESKEAKAAVEETVLVEAKRANETGIPTVLLDWQPHLRTITERALDRRDRTAARLCDELGLHLWQAGDYSGARPYLQKATVLHEEVSGTKHPDTASSLNNLGGLLQRQGDFSAARPYYERALTLRKEKWGLEHPDIAESLNNLGSLLRDQGAFAEARPYFEHALAIMERELGPENPGTASVLNNLGILLRIQGDFAGARPYYERALAIQQKFLGQEHLDTATSLNNLGALLQHQGDFKGAVSYCDYALAIRQKFLGPEHPITGSSLLNLASAWFHQGNFERARLYLERALPIFETRLGPDHPTTKDVRKRLDKVLEAQ